MEHFAGNRSRRRVSVLWMAHVWGYGAADAGVRGNDVAQQPIVRRVPRSRKEGEPPEYLSRPRTAHPGRFFPRRDHRIQRPGARSVSKGTKLIEAE